MASEWVSGMGTKRFKIPMQYLSRGSLFSPDVHSILHRDFGDPVITGLQHGKADGSPPVDTSAGHEEETPVTESVSKPAPSVEDARG